MEEKKSNLALWITALVTAFLILAFITNGFGLFTGKLIANSDYNVSIGNSPVLGNAEAKVTIYEFSDFSCPACAYADQNIFPQIYKDYIQTAKAKWVFKYFPGHGQGLASQKVALALADQNPDLFWKFAEFAYRNQAQTNNIDAMLAEAKVLGADMDKINAYLATSKPIDQLSSDIEMAKSNGIKGTPTFIINGKMIQGSGDYSAFQKAIDS